MHALCIRDDLLNVTLIRALALLVFSVKNSEDLIRNRISKDQIDPEREQAHIVKLSAILGGNVLVRWQVFPQPFCHKRLKESRHV